MTEPTNPLFEDEKDFLERKKLEYERALRGDVEEIKDNTVQAGKVALVGAGIVGGIWLLRKAFGGGSKAKKKHKHKKHHSHFEDYSGFDGFDENDQELNDLDTDFQSTDYDYEGDDNFAADEATNDGFYFDGQNNASFDYADEPSEDDDNGLSQYPDFPAHSAPQHGTDEDDALHLNEDSGEDEGPAHSYASSNSYQARPYDDSRRLPYSDSFAESEESDTEEAAPAQPKRSLIGPALLSFAKSETGRVIVAQAAAIGLALVTKAIQEFMPKHEAETGKNADLAASSANVGVPPATWPATSAAQDATAAAHHDDTISYREPLA
jgi:hypothetical protein